MSRLQGSDRAGPRRQGPGRDRARDHGRDRRRAARRVRGADAGAARRQLRGVSGSTTAIVLAAGAGRRFGGGKLLARIDGRPILQHVLDALAEAGIDDPVVVLGADAAAMDSVIDWRASASRHQPRTRARPVQLSPAWVDAAAGARLRPRAVLVVLADQPRLDPGVVRTLLAQPAIRPGPSSSRGTPTVRGTPSAWNRRQTRSSAPRPVTGGSGRSSTPGRSWSGRVEVDGTNPDVDEPADLVALLADAWARRVRDNATQVERIRETPDGRDFYATVSRTFVADPARDDDPVLEALLTHARPGETWLDIGAGAGRYALPIARRVREVIAVDPSTSMLEALHAGMAAHGIASIRTVEGRWPPDGHAPEGPRAGPARRRRAHRPRRLRRGGYPALRRRDGGRRPERLRRGPDGGEPGVRGGAVLAARPRRVAGSAAGAATVRGPAGGAWLRAAGDPRRRRAPPLGGPGRAHHVPAPAAVDGSRQPGG